MDDRPGADTAVLYGYHPDVLGYPLFRQERPDGPEHPRSRSDVPSHDSSLSAVGVHQVVSAVSWDVIRPGQGAGHLSWHAVSLEEWVGSRAAFSESPPEVQSRALSSGPGWNEGVWGTHLGGSLSVLTRDGMTLVRAPADGHRWRPGEFTSLLSGTVMVSDVYSRSFWTTDFLRLLLFRAGVSLERDVDEFHPTHLAMCSVDFSLWIGGWFSTFLTAGELARRVPFDTVAFPLSASSPVELVPEARFDLELMRVHAAGGVWQDPLFLP